MSRNDRLKALILCFERRKSGHLDQVQLIDAYLEAVTGPQVRGVTFDRNSRAFGPELHTVLFANQAAVAPGALCKTQLIAIPRNRQTIANGIGPVPIK